MPFTPAILNRTDGRRAQGVPLPSPRDMDTVATFTKIGVRLAGSLCGVPGIPILADAIVVLIETCESIPKQKQVHRAHVLLVEWLTQCPGRTSKNCRSDV